MKGERCVMPIAAFLLRSRMHALVLPVDCCCKVRVTKAVHNENAQHMVYFMALDVPQLDGGDPKMP